MRPHTRQWCLRMRRPNCLPHDGNAQCVARASETQCLLALGLTSMGRVCGSRETACVWGGDLPYECVQVHTFGRRQHLEVVCIEFMCVHGLPSTGIVPDVDVRACTVP